MSEYNIILIIKGRIKHIILSDQYPITASGLF